MQKTLLIFGSAVRVAAKAKFIYVFVGSETGFSLTQLIVMRC